jgi:hypothetical protein
VPFVVREHASGFYEYTPLIRDHVQASAYWLGELPDARIAVDELRREPAAAIFVHGQADPQAAGGRTLLQALLLPLLVRTAEACGGFDWEESAFARAYAELERSLHGPTRVYTAVAPLVGVSVGGTMELGTGLLVRPSTADELKSRWPEAVDLLPERFGQEPERTCLLELVCELPSDQEQPPEAPAELGDAVTAVRLATGAPAAGGPSSSSGSTGTRSAYDRYPASPRPSRRGSRAGSTPGAGVSRASCSSGSGASRPTPS